MKKLTVILAVALMLSLATPAFAFVDVPEGHWAQEYLERIAGVGIVIGFPDGTFRGAENLTRYQAATMTARMMDWVNETIEAALADVDFDDQEIKTDIRNLRSDLMVLMGEHFDLEFMVLQMQDDVEALDAKIAEVAAQMDATEGEIKSYVDQATRALRAEMQRQGLTDQQAEDVMIMIRALTREFRDDIEAIWAELEKEPQLSFSVDADFTAGYYKQISGPGIPYVNPFEHWGPGDCAIKPIVISEGPYFDYDLTLGIHGRTDKVDMDLTLGLYKDGMLRDAEYLSWGPLVGTVTTPHFGLTLTNWTSAEPTSYLRVLGMPGAVITHDKGSMWFLYGAPGEDDPDHFYWIGQYTAQPLDLLTSTFTFGTRNFDEEFVLGMKHVASIAPLTLTIDSAISDFGLEEGEEMGYFVTAGADVELGVLELGADYTLGTLGFSSFASGFPVRGGLGVYAKAGIGLLDLEAWYTDKHVLGDPATTVDNKVGGSVALAETLTFGPVGLDANAEYIHDLVTEEMHYDLRHVALSLGHNVDFYDFVLAYDHEDGPGRPVRREWWRDCCPEEMVPRRHDVTANLSLFPLDILEITAGARYNLLDTETRDMPVNLHGGIKVMPMDWLTLGANAAYWFDIEDPLSASAYANLAPGPFGLLGFDVSPSAGVWYGITAEALNYDVGLTLAREIAEDFDWVTSAVYDYREMNRYAGVGHPDGTWIEVKSGFEYCGIANLDFVLGKYNSLTDADLDYTYKGVEAGIGVSF